MLPISFPGCKTIQNQLRNSRSLVLRTGTRFETWSHWVYRNNLPLYESFILRSHQWTLNKMCFNN